MKIEKRHTKSETITFFLKMIFGLSLGHQQKKASDFFHLHFDSKREVMRGSRAGILQYNLTTESHFAERTPAVVVVPHGSRCFVFGFATQH